MKQLNFYKISQKDSHAKYINKETGRIFIIPMHYEIAKGTLKSTLEQAEVELNQFLKKL